MWVARFKLSNKGDIFTDRTKKLGVRFLAYPITHYLKSDRFYFVVSGFVEGEAKGQFISELRKDRRIVKLEAKGDYLNILIYYPNTEIVRTDMHTFYDPSIMHVEPIVNDTDGYEYWTVSSFEKGNLKSLIDSAVKLHNGKLLMMVKRKLDDLSVINIRPSISDKQKKTIIKAFEEGYYAYPRKIEIRVLAKMLKISYSTCQEHLRKAESALLPSMIKKL